ncbi:MAG TPA: Hsp20/alpha crystallin family protein [Ktedonobacterales bacterium]|nr:Hsp20/alpha crystallin family protein [Ktedonobacterales bacterium]
MSSVTRWDPIRGVTTLHDAMNQLFEQAFVRPGAGGLGSGTLGQMNALEADGQYVVQVLLPGIKPENIDLTVRQNVLSIKASQPEWLSEDLLKKSTFLLREFGPGELIRSITFPKDVDGDRVETRFERGVLTLAIPLAQHAQPKRITVRDAESSQPPLMVEDKTDKREPAAVN